MQLNQRHVKSTTNQSYFKVLSLQLLGKTEEKTMTGINHKFRYSCRESNRVPPEYKPLFQ